MKDSHAEHSGKNGAEQLGSSAQSMESGSDVAKTLVKPVAKAISILRFLVENEQPVRSAVVAKQLNINPSTCFNILRTLAAESVVDFDATSKTYQLGPAFFELAGGTPSDQRKTAIAKQQIARFSENHGVTATLWRVVDAERMVLEIVEYSADGMRVHMPAGQRLPILMGATGRAVVRRLGFTKAEAKKRFRKLRWSKPLSFDEYWQDADLAESRGWAVDAGYFSRGVLSVACPIFDLSGRLRYSAIAVSFRDQLNEREVDMLGSDILVLRDQLIKILV